MKINLRNRALGVALLGLLALCPAYADFIYVSTRYGIGKYNMDGSVVNASLVTGLNRADGLMLAGSDLYVVNNAYGGNASVGVYTTNGATVNATLLSLGQTRPASIAQSGANLYIFDDNENAGANSMGLYTTNGITVNAHLITGLCNPHWAVVAGAYLYISDYGLYHVTPASIGVYNLDGTAVNPSLVTSTSVGFGNIAVSGTSIYVANEDTGCVEEYTTSGALVTTNLISGFNLNSIGVELYQSHLFVTDSTFGTLGEYNLDGTAVNTQLITGLDRPCDVAFSVSAIPEPATVGIMVLLGGGLVGWRRLCRWGT